MIKLSQKQHLHSNLFNRPRSADVWLDQIEEQLVLKAWREGWLARDTHWQMWMEHLDYCDQWIPVVEVTMVAYERRTNKVVVSCND